MDEITLKIDIFVKADIFSCRLNWNSMVFSPLNDHQRADTEIPMNHTPSLKSFLEWSAFGIFIILACSVFMVCCGTEPGTIWQDSDIEQVKSVDGGDIEAKIAAKSSSGVVWGTIKPKTTVTESADPVPATPAPAAAPVLPDTPALPLTEPKAEKYLLKSSRKKGSTDKVETLLEVTGDVKQIDSTLKETKEKMEVVAGFRYEEQIDQMLPNSLVSIRQYELAKSKMKIGDQIKMPELPAELQTIVCSLDKDHVTLFSPAGSLRGEQLLLIEDIPGNTLTLDRLLPNTETSIGESWKIDESVLRSFLSVDAITSSNVEAVLTAVAENDMAIIEVVGDVSGVYLGAATEMSVRAKIQFDLAVQRINWIGVIIEENRSIGHVGPGLNLTARLQIKISPLDAPQILTDAFKMTINTMPADAVMQLKYDGGKGPWRFAHDRTWYSYQDDPQATVLRKLSGGELVAQCNIADMGTVDVKTMSTLDKFQQDLINGLGKNFGKVAAASQYEDKRGYKVYKVILDGMVDDLSLRWIYHLLTDSSGKQSVVVFVVEAAMLEQFADADEVLLATYQMGK